MSAAAWNFEAPNLDLSGDEEEASGAPAHWIPVYIGIDGGSIFPWQIGFAASPSITYAPLGTQSAKGANDLELIRAGAEALSVRILVEWAVDTNCTLTFRKRAADGTWSDAQTLSMPSASGAAQDEIKTQALAAGEALGLHMDGGGGGTMTWDFLRIFMEVT